MKNLLYKLTLLIIAVLYLAVPAARADEFVDPYKDYDEFVFFDYTLDENLVTPPVGKAEHRAVHDYMNRVKEQLRDRYTLDMARNGEVVIVTVPTDELFLPNDTLLTRRGEDLLKPLLPYMQDPMMIKLVYTVHTDDSGSPSYLEHLSEARSNTLYSWLLEDRRVPEDLFIIPYPMADEENIVPNDSRKNRATNRRIEIYFIPGPKMITKAHEGSLR